MFFPCTLWRSLPEHVHLSHAEDISGDLSMVFDSDDWSLLEILSSLSSQGVGFPSSSSPVPTSLTVLVTWHSSGSFPWLSSNSAPSPLAFSSILWLQPPVNWWIPSLHSYLSAGFQTHVHNCLPPWGPSGSKVQHVQGWNYDLFLKLAFPPYHFSHTPEGQPSSFLSPTATLHI